VTANCHVAVSTSRKRISLPVMQPGGEDHFSRVALPKPELPAQRGDRAVDDLLIGQGAELSSLRPATPSDERWRPHWVAGPPDRKVWVGRVEKCQAIEILTFRAAREKFGGPERFAQMQDDAQHGTHLHPRQRCTLLLDRI